MPVDQSINQSEQGVNSLTKMCAIVGSLIIVLLTLLQLKSENKDATPFETYGLLMMFFIATMLIYSLVAVAAITLQASFTNHSLAPVLNQICIAAGFLACDLLLLILAPPFGYFFLVIWVFLLLLVLYRFLRNCAVYKKVKEIFQIWYDLLFHAASQPSGASPRTQTSIEQQDGLSEISGISNEMNVELAMP